ncbi:subtilisin-like protein [Xylaria sp. CBS 124048]|nr:subtilisin-like protein [Xylaria sp. CBS 124048]
MKTQSLLCAAIAAIASLNSITMTDAKHILVESLPVIPTGWSKLSDANNDQVIKLRIALEQPGLEHFEQALYDVSTPNHPRYGQHLSREDVRELVKPHEKSTAAVLRWLRSAGIRPDDIEEDGEWINFNTTVSKAADLLDTEFGVYSHAGTVKRSVRTLRYSVPEEIRSHITMIQPTTRFGQVRPQFTASHVVEESELSGLMSDAASLSTAVLNETFCNQHITPACLRALYTIGSAQGDPNIRGSFGITGFLEQYAKHNSLKTFIRKYASYASEQDFETIKVNGGLDNQKDKVDNDVEANLDMQYAVAIGYGQDFDFYSVGGRGPVVPDLSEPDPNIVTNEPYLELLTYLLSLPNVELPHTLTASYGEDEQSVPAVYAKKICLMFAQLGARGVSVIFSSGDTGPGASCLSNDGKNTTRFLPIFPASCPHLTSVGATRGVQPEHAAHFSSGGFSDLHHRPFYQEAAVSTYLSTLGSTFAGLYNPRGRGYPDVSAQGANYLIISQQETLSVSGTSASAPTFAAIVSLLNNIRISRRVRPLGFLNPWLYGHGSSVFTDIVDGGSLGCTGQDTRSGLPGAYVPGAGWNATTGWDPVTGLGTPLFDKLFIKAMPGIHDPSNILNEVKSSKAS